MAKASLTTREVAHLIGVGEATVKRWAEKRLIFSERTVGGHRRFRLEDVARFLRERAPGNKGQADARLRIVPLSDRSVRADSAAAERDLFRALRAGQEREAAASLIRAHLSGASLGSVFDDLLCGAMRKVGDLWYGGELSIDEEHLATRTAINAIHLLRVVLDLPEAGTRRAICCSTEEDFHDLPVQLTQLILESEGWQVVNLGANTPFFALGEALVRHAPELVCVSSTILSNPDRAAREYQAFKTSALRRGTTVLLGGKGFEPERIRSRFPADHHADDFRKLANVLGLWKAADRVDAAS